MEAQSPSVVSSKDLKTFDFSQAKNLEINERVLTEMEENEKD
jgi:hypothetical protein